MRRGARILGLLLVAACLASPVRGQEVPADTTGSPARSEAESDTIFSAADRARFMLDTLRIASDSLATLESRLSDPGADLDFLRVLALEQVRGMQHTMYGLAELATRTGPDSIPLDSVRTIVRGQFGAHLDLIDRLFESVVGDFEDLRRQRVTAPPEATGPLEVRIGELRQRADTLVRYQELALTVSDSLGLDLDDRWESYDRRLLEFAESATGRLLIAVAERDELQELIRVAERTDAPESEIAGLRLRLAAAEMRIDAIAGNMEVVTARLAGRGFETAAYREVLIRATGDVTGDVLDPEVLGRLGRRYATDSWQYLRRNAGTAFVRVLIVLGFILLFRILFRLLWRLGTSLRLVRGPKLATDLFGRLLRPVATLVGLFVGLSVIGVETTTLLAGLGIAGLVIGLALQDSLSNLFAGISILASKAFDVDDVVEVAGVVGKVRQLGLWNTTIVTFDGRRLLIPNRSIWGSNVENRSVEPTRRADAVARIGYDTDLQAAIGVLEELLAQDERVLKDPAPRVWVSQLDESWAEVRLWAWTKTADWWSLYSDLPRLTRLKLAEAGIEVPVPRRDVTTRVAESSGHRSDTES